MKDARTIIVLAAGALGAAWLLEKHTHGPASPVNPDGIFINGRWLSAETHVHHEMLRNFFLTMKAEGQKLMSGVIITGDSGTTDYHPLNSDVYSPDEGGFTLADVEDWQDAGHC